MPSAHPPTTTSRTTTAATSTTTCSTSAPIADALAHLKRADVLFLGNSRLMFAARPGVFDAFFTERGLRYYVLGFGFREADRFPLAIIEKFDLRPRVVVVNADGFFQNHLSDFARTVIEGLGRSARGSSAVEAETGHEVRRAVHQLVPNYIDVFGRPGFAMAPRAGHLPLADQRDLAAIAVGSRARRRCPAATCRSPSAVAKVTRRGASRPRWMPAARPAGPHLRAHAATDRAAGRRGSPSCSAARSCWPILRD